MFFGSGACEDCAGSYGFVFVVCLLAEAAYRPAATRFLLSCQKKPGKEKARLADGCPAELTARLQRSVHTAAGNLKDIHKVGARRLR